MILRDVLFLLSLESCRQKAANFPIWKTGAKKLMNSAILNAISLYSNARDWFTRNGAMCSISRPDWDIGENAPVFFLQLQKIFTAQSQREAHLLH